LTIDGFDSVIPPGQEGKITLTLIAVGFTGLISKSVEVTTNDPQRPKFTLLLHAFIIVPGPHPGRRVGPFVFTPSPRWSARVPRGGSAKTSFTIYNDGPQPVRLTQLIPGGEAFALDLETLQAGRLYVVTAKSAPSLLTGKYAQTVKLATESSEFPELSLQLEVTIIPPILAEPEALSFSDLQLSSVGTDAQVESRFILIKQARGGRLEVKGVSVTLPFLKVVVEGVMVPGQVYRLKVDCDREKLTKGDYQGKIRVETNNPDAPVIEIPVTVAAR